MRLIRSACAVALSLSAIQIASAADIPVRAPVRAPAAIPAPVFSWTGCYIGGHVGGGWANKDWNDNIGGTSHTADGVIAGGQVGCDYQTGVWVFGAEGQFSWANLDGESVNPAFPTETDRSKIDFVGTVTGRLGYAVDRSLFYVKGGGAWVNEKFSITDTAVGGAVHFDGGSQTRWGWTVGAGFEYAFAPGWSAKIEYNYMDFGSKSVVFNDVIHADPSFTVPGIDQQIHTVMFGVNWRWGAGRY
jgi:outer membrane immunogenic protein